jgi:hypothetical protein
VTFRAEQPCQQAIDWSRRKAIVVAARAAEQPIDRSHHHNRRQQQGVERCPVQAAITRGGNDSLQHLSRVTSLMMVCDVMAAPQ